VLYGGTERVVSYLTEELVHQGHEVTLFASGDSLTAAQLVSVWDTALRLDPRDPEPTSLHVLMIEEVFRRATQFDLIHFHIDAVQLPLSRRHSTPCVSTMHGRLDIAGLDALYREFRDMPLVSISDAQRTPLPVANWAGTVLHGLPPQIYVPGPGPGNGNSGYLALIGRISPEKGIEHAIRIAHASGMPLKIAAKVARSDREYFEAKIKPLIDGQFIEFLGEVNETDKARLLGEAAALLFPIVWPEPFGMVMIESMACATPVIAFRRGSVPEIIEDGVNGYIVDSVEEAVQRVAQLDRLDRSRCRQIFEQRFSAERMAWDYTKVYQRLCTMPRAA
jgi:glycosyltransferase involved in cell wall biosynthesis